MLYRVIWHSREAYYLVAVTINCNNVHNTIHHHLLILVHMKVFTIESCTIWHRVHRSSKRITSLRKCEGESAREGHTQSLLTRMNPFGA